MTTEVDRAHHERPFDRFVESLRKEGTSFISPKKFADAFDVQVQDLAADLRVHRNTINTHPASPRIQRFLRDTLKLLSAIDEIHNDMARSKSWVRNHPIPPLGHNTAWDLTLNGRADDVVAYLESISDREWMKLTADLLGVRFYSVPALK
ncbi:DNA-binding protein [Salinisphaera hydrothermalis]|uniref:DNA-binding protein n=1 Tax=Salinisphaera hydrothermalis TaxID=563188 RepID=UPI00333FA3D7